MTMPPPSSEKALERGPLAGGGDASLTWAQSCSDACSRFLLSPDLRGRALQKFLLAMAVLGALGSYYVRGYAPSLYNGVVQLPLLKQRINPELYPNDLLLRSLHNYESLLWDLIAGAGHVMPLLTAMGVFYAIQLVFFHYAISAFVWRLGRSVLAVVLANVFFMGWMNPGFGGSYYSAVTASHGPMSFPFFVLAMVAVLDARFALAGALWGVGALFHLPNSVYCAPMLGLMALASLRRPPLPWSAVVKQALIGAPLAAVGFGLAAWRVASEGGSDLQIPMDQFRLLTRNYVGPHVFWQYNVMSSGHKNAFASFVIQGLLAIGLIVLTRRVERRGRCLLWGILGGVLVAMLGLVIGDLGNSVAIARLMLLRVGDFLDFLFLATALAMTGYWAAGRISASPWLLPPFLAFYFLGLESWAGRKQWWEYALGLLVLAWVIDRLMRQSGPRRTIKAALRRAMPGWVFEMPRAMRVTALLALIALPFIAVSMYEERFERQKRLEDDHTSGWAQDWRRVQRWARTKTPVDTMFLTPPTEAGWRSFSERGTFLEFRDANAVVLNNTLNTEFLRRAEALGYDLSQYEHAAEIDWSIWSKKSPRELAAIARAEGLRYVVAYRVNNIPPEYLVSDNNTFVIMDTARMPASSPDSAAPAARVASGS